MKANEMFKKEGFKEVFGYSLKIYEKEETGEKILFWSPSNIDINVNYLSVKVLNAIAKQAEELGWK